ncbi:DUF488 domain-containing protein [Variovorax sp. WS11]|uniref:DUF488 domain-containing protein n=1 Tax=Variovorax sp. WS11 TaxID=1105204 RepID=UPI0013DA6548|nr:DUF488 family protein [Variovorax sp. WS11]NDZ16913.1 DUF488 family protein [Variovorax sp. WS11]
MHSLISRSYPTRVSRRPRLKYAAGTLLVKRARDSISDDDGLRILVDRRWPAGMTKQRVGADLWLREAGPSIALQRWRCRLHTSSGWESFCRKYRAELAEHEDLLCLLDDLLCRSRLTLLFDASDASHNGAVVLRDVLNERRGRAEALWRSDA